MVQHKTSDQYLTSGKVSTGSGDTGFIKTLTKNFNILWDGNANTNADADADAVVSATGQANKAD